MKLIPKDEAFPAEREERERKKGEETRKKWQGKEDAVAGTEPD